MGQGKDERCTYVTQLGCKVSSEKHLFSKGTKEVTEGGNSTEEREEEDTCIGYIAPEAHQSETGGGKKDQR